MASIKNMKLFRSKLALVGATLSFLVVVLSFIGPLISPYGPSEFTPDILKPPSSIHLLGTDGHGRDLFSRILGGGWITLTLSIVTVVLSGLVGTLWGLLGAYIKGFWGNFINRGTDVVMSFPSIMTALLVLAIVRTSGSIPLIIAIAITYVPRFARVIRGSTLSILEEDFILAEKALGAGHFRILMLNVLPNLVSQITVLATIYVPYTIMLESSLSFLGLGVPPDVPTWGRIISDGKSYIKTAPWLTIFPGIAIMLASLAFNLLGDGLRDIFDPKSTSYLFGRKGSDE